MSSTAQRPYIAPRAGHGLPAEYLLIAEQHYDELSAHYRVLDNWDGNAPDRCLERHGGGSWTISMRRRWIDHPYRLRDSDGRMIYAAEPYGLDEDDLEDLAGLVSEGWDVWIGLTPIWYPGRTTQVLVRRRKTKA